MIITFLYFALFCFVIYKTHYFGVLKDEHLDKATLLTGFVIKCLGILAFYVVYNRFYGGLQAYDSQHFYHDSKLLRDIARWDAGEFLKVLFGFFFENAGTKLFGEYISKTEVWDKDPSESLYNDNRLVIRLHALIHFISFGRYGVH